MQSMCELLGLSFNQTINPSFSFEGLLAGSDINPHGWGLGFYSDNCRSAMLFKEPMIGCCSQLAEFLFSYRELRSRTFLCHIRKASKGVMSYDNTHPFSRFYNGLEMLFAHNGSLHRQKRLNRLTYRPAGRTDSERAFCYLLSQLRKCKIKPISRGKYLGYSADDFRAILEILVDINVQGDGAFNAVFTDGVHLFCYRDIDSARPLFFLKRRYPFSQTVLRDSDLQVNLNLEKGRTEEGYIVASTPLSSEDWASFECGQLIVFKNGEVVADIGIDDGY